MVLVVAGAAVVLVVDGAGPVVVVGLVGAADGRESWVATATTPVTITTANRPLSSGTSQERCMPLQSGWPLPQDELVGAHDGVDGDRGAVAVLAFQQ